MYMGFMCDYYVCPVVVAFVSKKTVPFLYKSQVFFTIYIQFAVTQGCFYADV